jgi:clan AA aspartic protease
VTTGFLSEDREPILPLEIRGPDGARTFEAIVDTGFNGALILPASWIDALGLPQFGTEPVVLADGSRTVSPVYRGYVILEDEVHEAIVAEGPTPLLGIDLLWGFSLDVEFQVDGAVEVESLPSDPS